MKRYVALAEKFYAYIYRFKVSPDKSCDKFRNIIEDKRRLLTLFYFVLIEKNHVQKSVQGAEGLDEEDDEL